VASCIKYDTPALAKKNRIFMFYDSVLLNVLANSRLPGKKIFSDMFSKNKITDIFTFLDNESNIFQDLRIISSFPTIPFLKAGWQQLF